MAARESRVTLRVIDEATGKSVPELLHCVELERMWDLGTLEGWQSFRSKGRPRPLQSRGRRRGDALLVPLRHASPWLLTAGFGFGQTKRRSTPAYAVAFPGDRVEMAVSVIDVEVLLRRDGSINVARELNEQDAACAETLLAAMPRVGTFGAVSGRLFRPSKGYDGDTARAYALGRAGRQELEALLRFERRLLRTEWVLAPLRPGPYRIVVAHTTSEIWKKDVVVEAGKTVDLGAIRPTPATRSMTVQVVDEGNRSVTEAAVYAWAQGLAVPHWQGGFMKMSEEPVVIGGIPAGCARLEVHIEKRGYGRTYAELPLTSTAATVRIEPLDDGGFVECSVVNQHGDRIDGAKILTMERLDAKRYVLQTGADPKTGRLRLSGLPGGAKKVRIRATCGGYRSRTLSVPLGRTDVVIALQRVK